MCDEEIGVVQFACNEDSDNRKRHHSELQSTSDCPICLQPWSSNGAHRIAVLKCGHLFGQECIERWIKVMTCNRPIFSVEF